MAGTFDEQSIRRIARSVLDSERRNRSRQIRGKRNRHYPPGESQQWTLVAKVRTGGIPAINTGTNAPGSATVDLYAVNEGVSPAVMLDLSTFVIAYNVSDTAIPAGKFVPLTREPTSGVWIAVFGGEGGSTVKIAKTSPGSAIPARDGVTLSSQSCEIFTIDTDTDELVAVSPSEFLTVWNYESRPVPKDEYFPILQEEGSGRWVAVVPLGYDRCRGTTTTTVASTEPTFSVDNVKVTKGRNPLADPESLTETVTVNNSFEWDIPNDGLVFFEWHDDDEEWHAYQVICP